MSMKTCYEKGTNNVNRILFRTSELRKGKSILELSQSEGMKQAWNELKEYENMR